jgi:hypothetical protein
VNAPEVFFGGAEQERQFFQIYPEYLPRLQVYWLLGVFRARNEADSLTANPHRSIGSPGAALPESGTQATCTLYLLLSTLVRMTELPVHLLTYYLQKIPAN